MGQAGSLRRIVNPPGLVADMLLCGAVSLGCSRLAGGSHPAVLQPREGGL